MRMVNEERREVRQIEKDFADKIEGVKSLAQLAKEKGKKMTQQINDGCSGIL